MKLRFAKYQATGNDFVLIDNRSGKYSFTQDQIEKVCDRKFGIGADGLMLIEKHPELDFNLVYYNRDGSQSLCGNGSRAAVQMAASLGMMNGKTKFNAYDGTHVAEILPAGIIKLKMNDVSKVQQLGEDFFMNTGSPHFIRFVKNIRQYPVFEEGRKIRYSDSYKPDGTNVNFVELLPDNTIFVRTYERGVEDETLSCGTGVVASALAASLKNYTSPVKVKTLGGDLSVEFSSKQSHDTSPLSAVQSDLTSSGSTFRDIFLVGPAKLVFEGDLEL
jgi:diaminopimelate epimerase